MRRSTSKIVLAAVALALAAGAPAGAHPDDWLTYQSNVRRDGRHESRINRSNVALLRPKWTKHTSESVTATPAVVVFDDFDPVTPGEQPKKVVYVGSATGLFYALDAADGSELWTFTADAATGLGYHMFVSSPTIDRDRGRLYVGGGFTMYALDLYDGSVVWKWSTRNHGAGQIETSPLLLNDGNGAGTVHFGSDLDGSIPGVSPRWPASFAVDAETGALRWYWRPGWPLDSVDEVSGAPKISSCGDVWASLAGDPVEGLLYMATSDCTRGTQGLYNEAVIALPIAPPAACGSDTDSACLDGATLERRREPPDWYYQPRLVDPYDADFGSTPLLFDRDGKKYLGIGGKDGFYYVIERQRSGVPDTYRSPVWLKRVVMGGFAGGFIGSTATDGTRIWGATAMFDIPTEAQSTFLTPNPFAQPPFLHAFDATTGEIAWQQLGPGPTFAATTTTNDVIFVSSLDSLVMALDGKTGQVLWTAPVLGPSSSGAAISGDEIFVGSGTEAQGLSLPELAGINAFVLVADAEEIDGVPPSLPPAPWPLEEPVRYPFIPDEATPHPEPTPTP